MPHISLVRLDGIFHQLGLAGYYDVTSGTVFLDMHQHFRGPLVLSDIGSPSQVASGAFHVLFLTDIMRAASEGYAQGHRG